jgi:hypothetical protein
MQTALMTDASADPDSAPATATPAATKPERALLDAANRMICPPPIGGERSISDIRRVTPQTQLRLRRSKDFGKAEMRS